MTRGHARTLAIALAVALALLFVPSTALAAQSAPKSSKTTGATPPVVVAPIDVQIWPGENTTQTAVIVGVQLPDSVKLPAVVRLPVPPGVSIEWTGEVLGGDVSQDIQRPFIRVKGSGAEYVEFILSTSHRGQLDTIGIPTKVSGTQASAEVKWVQSVVASSTTISVRIPPASSKVKIDPAPVGDPAVNAAGESLYTLKPKQLKVGDTEVVKLSYSTVPEAFNAGPSSTTIALIVLGILLVVAVAVLAVFLSRQRRMPLGEDEGYDEEYEEDLAEEADLTNAPASGDDSENGDDIEELDWSDRDR